MHDSILFFDGVCNLCNGLIRFLMNNEKNHQIKYASLQSDVAKQFPGVVNISQSNNSLIFIQNNVVYKKSRAVFKISKHLKFPWSLAGIFRFLPVTITDTVYDFIAKNRYRFFGKSEKCFLPEKKYLHRFLK